MENRNEQDDLSELKKTENSLKEQILQLEKLYKELAREQNIFALDGDLCENKDWETVREKREFILFDIQKKKEQLEDIKNPEKIKKKLEIVYSIEKTGAVKTVFLIKNINSINDPKNGIISYNSPLGIALFNAKENCITQVISPQNTYEIKILSKKWVTS